MSWKVHYHALVQGTIDTCIRAELYFPEYEPYTLDILVDTGATKCIARKPCFPEELWKQLEKPIMNTVADGGQNMITEFVQDVVILLNKKRFTLREVPL